MSKPFRKTRHALAYVFAQLFISTVQHLPRKMGLFLFRQGALFVSLFLKRDNQVIEKNLTEIYGDSKTAEEIKKIKKGVFLNLGASLFDAIHLPFLPPEKFRKIVDFDLTQYHEAQAKGKGIIALTGHISCFELASQLMSMDGVDTFIIGAPLFDERIGKIVENLRTRNGVTYFDRNNSGRKLFKGLKSGKLFGSLLDQDTTDDGVFSHFMGRLAFTPSGPIHLALKLRIPLFFSVLERQPDDTYRYSFKEVTLPDTGDVTENLCRGVEAYNEYLTEHINLYPEQWVWLHKRWKRKREDFPEIASITDYTKK